VAVVRARPLFGRPPQARMTRSAHLLLIVLAGVSALVGTETFDGSATKTAYVTTTAIVIDGTLGAWSLGDQVLLYGSGTFDNCVDAGGRCLRGRSGGVATMLFDVADVASLTLSHALFGVDTTPVAWSLQRSTTAGATWTSVGAYTSASSTPTPVEILLGDVGPTRYRVLFGASSARVNLDNFAFTAMPPPPPPPPAAASVLSETFEGATQPTAYTGGPYEVVYGSGAYSCAGAVAGSLSGDNVQGTGLRLKAATTNFFAMAFDLEAIGSVSLQVARYGSDSPSEFAVESSCNGGASWGVYAGLAAVPVATTSLVSVEGAEMLPGACRLRVRPTSGTSQRFNVDTWLVTYGAPAVGNLCGDGLREEGEACDDGGLLSGDGCDAACAIEPGFFCDQGSPTVCIDPVCANGAVEYPEACDDGNAVSGDGCTYCSIDAGYNCAGSPSICTLPPCGDGLVQYPESCDDGNLVGGDGCAAGCTRELGWACVGEPSACTAVGTGCDAASCAAEANGAPFRACLRATCFGGHTTLGYTAARVAMYNWVDNAPATNALRCVYTGFEHAFGYGGSTTATDPINCEHTLPQSFFRYPGETEAREPMRSDMHHLFPTHKDPNAFRGHLDFGELDDASTSLWYSESTLVGATSPPLSPEEASKRSVSGSETLANGPWWEPPEAHKGDATRAIFYMYTFYEEELLAAAAAIAPSSPYGYPGSGLITDAMPLATALAWHAADPASLAEMQRSEAIAFHQGNGNPFVSGDAGLAARAFPL
jgi:cysteine-rich repeat protein